MDGFLSTGVFVLFAKTSLLTAYVGVDAAVAGREVGIILLYGLVAFEREVVLLLRVVDIGFLEEDARNDLPVAFGFLHGLLIGIDRLAVLLEVDLTVSFQDKRVGCEDRF